MPGIRGPGRRRPCWPRPRPGPPVTGAQLASYAGLAPVTRRSGSSIRGEHVTHAGNKRLTRAVFLSAFASLRSDPVSRAYCQRKRDQANPDPARHDPGWSPLRSTTISTPTRSRLTHHIGAPPGSRRPPARRARREGDRRRPLRRASDHVRRRGGSRVPLAHAPPSSRLCNPFARTASVDALRALGSPHANLSAAQSGTQQGPSRTAWVGTSTSVVVGF